MLFINNVNVMIFYFDYFFSYHIKLSEVCNYVLYLGYVNLLLNIMVAFNSPLTLFPIPRGPGRWCRTWKSRRASIRLITPFVSGRGWKVVVSSVAGLMSISWRGITMIASFMCQITNTRPPMQIMQRRVKQPWYLSQSLHRSLLRFLSLVGYCIIQKILGHVSSVPRNK